jgi:hypothetical protein
MKAFVEQGRAGATNHSRPMHGRGPLPWRSAAGDLLRSAATTVRLLVRRRTHLPPRLVGTSLSFADDTSARVFRETTVDRGEPSDPCLLVVRFRLRVLRGRWHRLFLWECILNTPLFVGFPGFVSKLWLDRDAHDNYRGLYEWDGAARAARYASSLWRVLGLVCPSGTIDYVVLPGLRRADVLENPARLASIDAAGDAWWRVIEREDVRV